MSLSKIRFKGYSWEHNPKTLTIEKQRILREQFIPFGKSKQQNMGERSKVVKGTGQLFGEDCFEQYLELLELQSRSGSGILSLPDTKPFYAYFKSLELECEPSPNLITYNFVFVD